MTCSIDAHTAGDVIANTQLAAATHRANDVSGILYSIDVVNADNNTVAIDVWVLRAAHDVGAESGVIDITTTEARDVVHTQKIATADWDDNTTHTRFQSDPIGKPCLPVPGTDDLSS